MDSHARLLPEMAGALVVRLGVGAAMNVSRVAVDELLSRVREGLSSMSPVFSVPLRVRGLPLFRFDEISRGR